MKVITNFPIALNSPDHLRPTGTAEDNTTDLKFIEEIEKYFNRKIKTLDVGCSGGQLTVDFFMRGHESIGIEGSDFSVINSRANWPEYHNKILFTCDATKSYKIIDENYNDLTFDLITAFEVLEHISNKDFDTFFNNILNHMDENSIFCASIAPVEDERDGYKIHQSVYDRNFWINEILSKYFFVQDLPFQNKVRYGDSFHVLCKKRL